MYYIICLLSRKYYKSVKFDNREKIQIKKKGGKKPLKKGPDYLRHFTHHLITIK